MNDAMPVCPRCGARKPYHMADCWDRPPRSDHRNEIIEKCARVVESFKGIVVVTPGDIADAIRALKQ